MDLGAVAKKLTTRAAKRKLIRAVPVIGLVLSAFYIVQKIRTKGWRRGGIDAALDMTPGVGRAKALYEAFNDDLIQPKHAREEQVRDVSGPDLRESGR